MGFISALHVTVGCTQETSDELLNSWVSRVVESFDGGSRPRRGHFGVVGA